LKLGAAGTIAFWVAGCARRVARVPADAGQRDIVRRLADAMLDGALPAEAAERERALEIAASGFGVAVAGLPSEDRAQIAQLFWLLGFAPTRRIVAGLPPWNQTSRQQVAAFLDRWRFGNLVALRGAYDVLHQLVMAGWYGNDAAWIAIGYPGPPRIVA
jgi:hypothetical protein